MVGETREPLEEIPENTDAEQWDDFRMVAMPAITNPVQIEEMRRAFYAGFQSSMSSHIGIAELPEDDGVAQMDRWLSELKQFFDEITVEHYGQTPPRH